VGIRYFDVAPLYGYGRSEILLGTALRELPREEFVVSTKVGRYFRPSEGQMDGLKQGGLSFRPVLDYSRDGASRSLDQSMLRLGLARIDAVFVHDVDAHALGSEEAAEAAFADAMKGVYPALVELKRAGVIQAIGVGVNQVYWAQRWIREADLDCVMLAGRYTLLNQEAAPEFLPECQRRDVSVLAAGAFNGGLIARGPQPGSRFNYRPAPDEVLDRTRQLQAIAAETGTDLAAAAIQLVVNHPAVTSLVSGAMHPHEIEQNARALNTPVPQAFWDRWKTLAGLT
jgi:D-threo-aldose 1-dehydrogenase